MVWELFQTMITKYWGIQSHMHNSKKGNLDLKIFIKEVKRIENNLAPF